jgi:hypothetical protein
MSTATIRTTSPHLERRSKPRPVRTVVMHPGKFNLITQVRKTYYGDSIKALGDSIAELGQIELPVVAELDPEHVGFYIAYFNRVLGSTIEVSELVQDHQTGHYFIVICGHRRTKACVVLWENGCSSCQEDHGKKAASKCLKSHDLAVAGMEVRARYNIDPETALQMQIAENTKEAVSQEDEAEALRADYEALTRAQPGLTKVAFARKLNLKTSVVTSALRFCDLPAEIKRSYREGRLTFSSAVELWRLQDAGCNSGAMLFSLQKVVASNMKSVDVRKYVSGVIKSRAQGAEDGYGLFEDLEDDGRIAEIRRSVERTAHLAFHAEAEALRHTQSAMEDGLLPKLDVTLNLMVKRSIEEGNELREHLTLIVESA